MPWAGTDAGSPIRMWQVRPRRRLGVCSNLVVTIVNYAVPVVLSWADSYSITCNILFFLPFVPCRPLKNMGTQAGVTGQGVQIVLQSHPG